MRLTAVHPAAGAAAMWDAVLQEVKALAVPHGAVAAMLAAAVPHGAEASAAHRVAAAGAVGTAAHLPDQEAVLFLAPHALQALVAA